MEEDYFIINEYVRDSSFESYLTPELFVSPYNGTSNLETSLGFEIKHLSDTALFLVSVLVNCITKLDDGRRLFKLDLRYDILVAIKHDLSEDAIRNYLGVIVPQDAYPRIQEAVNVRTKDIGFSEIVLDNYSFKDKKVNIDNEDNISSLNIENKDEAASCEQHIDFRSLIEDIENCKEGAEFLQVFRNNGGQLQSFKDFNLYRCLFRFMKCVEYSVAPNVHIGCEAKELIYFLIAGSDECEWRFEKSEESKNPELVFNYKESYDEFQISKMTESELFDLCSSLIVDLITKAAVNFLLIESEMGGATLPMVTNFVTREDYRNAFDYHSLDNEQQAFIDSMYDKIARTQVETFLYQEL